MQPDTTIDGTTIDRSSTIAATTVSGTVIDVLSHARTVRSFSGREVSPELVQQLVFAATRASSGRNSQPWIFVAIRDEATKRALGQLLRPRVDELRDRLESIRDPARARLARSAAALLAALPSAPVIVFVAGRRVQWSPPFDERLMLHTALATASQNLLVAARSLGLGAAYTMAHLHPEPDVRTLLELPDDVEIGTTMPIGWPRDVGGPVSRQPVGDGLMWDRYRR